MKEQNCNNYFNAFDFNNGIRKDKKIIATKIKFLSVTFRFHHIYNIALFANIFVQTVIEIQLALHSVLL